MNLITRFNTYQKERFPLVILAITTVSVAMSSAAVLGRVQATTIIFATLAAIVYLFHIRVIDEVRDHAHDATHHSSRPIHRGVISLKELQSLDICSIGIFLVIAFFFGKLSLITALVCLLYTYIASKEFFLGDRIKSRFLVYNAVNIAQMLLLQLFIYSIFSETWYQVNNVGLHLAFIFSNSVLLEVLRKIKIVEEESKGKDTYSWHIGFHKSLYTLLAIAGINYLIFVRIIFLKASLIPFMISGFLVLLLLLSLFGHGHKKVKKSENFLYLAILSLYVGLNLIIYFVI